MPKTNPEARAALIRDLVNSIAAEDRTFQMDYWVTTDRDGLNGPLTSRYEEAPASCETASCIAGHLEAVRPELALELVDQFRSRYGVEHAHLAAAIYQAETGEACPFDFWGHLSSKDLEHITREDAVAHIRGEHDEWPLLDCSIALLDCSTARSRVEPRATRRAEP
jgi:hypothetical protein